MRPFIPVRRLTLIPLLATTLAACGGVPAAPVTNVQAPAVSVVAQAPTATTAPTATSTPTSTPTLTPTLEPTATPTLEPTPKPDISDVTGDNSYARGAISQRPWMVMIDNHPDAYPQSGMDQASMVFEGLAEYGITRFIALYADGISPDVAEIGPVRSTRLYFAQWAMGFHPIYAHAGGSPDGVALAETTDQFINFEALNERNYTWRDNARLAPHNLYTNAKLLRTFAVDKGASEFTDPTAGYLFDRIDAAPSPEATTINYYFEDKSSRAGFRFDAATNRYYRTMRGQPHIDRVSGEQLWTRNIVVMQVDEQARAGDEKRRIDQNVIGSGEARIFSAGRVINGTWRKDSAETPLRFYDETGSEIVFNVGTMWVAAIPTMDHLTVE